jgi:signal transduction histidine kinase
MKYPSWLADTIALRFAMTQAAAVAAALALVLLFNAFGGVWSREPLDSSGLLNEASDIVRIIEAASPSVRETLAAASTTREFRADWYSATSAASRWLDDRRGSDGGETVDRLFAQTHRIALVFGPGRHEAVPPWLDHERSQSGAPYALAVRLNDGSWLVFAVPVRYWGISRAAHWLVRLTFVALSISIVTAFATQQFLRPVKRIVAAVRQFGLDPRAPPIVETGPRELRQVIATFNGMQAQIQKFVAYRTMMLAAISHDLRTPLTRMRLRGEFIDDPEQQARLFRDVDEMQAMVDGALVFFRDDAVAEATTTFDLSHVLLTIANDCADQKIEVSYTGPTHAVYQGRPFALKRAFTNLVENAIKYATAPQIELSCAGTAYVVIVRDRGPGIPDASLQNVFRPYYRLDRSRNRATGGVGLGLTVAQAIVHAHGGEIVLSNRSGGGVEARVTLPLSASVGNQAPPPA